MNCQLNYTNWIKLFKYLWCYYSNKFFCPLIIFFSRKSNHQNMIHMYILLKTNTIRIQRYFILSFYFLLDVLIYFFWVFLWLQFINGTLSSFTLPNVSFCPIVSSLQFSLENSHLSILKGRMYTSINSLLDIIGSKYISHQTFTPRYYWWYNNIWYYFAGRLISILLF